MRTFRRFVITLLVLAVIFIVWRAYTSSESPLEMSIKDFSARIKDSATELFNGTKDVATGISDYMNNGDIPKGIRDTIEKVSSDLLNTKPDPTTFTEAEVAYVVDGDTLKVKVGGEEKYVRLIGINTEESVHPEQTRNNQFGVEASDHTKAIMKNVTKVWLEYDISPTDKYDRELCYVWLSTDTSDFSNMLNARILADGYADVMEIAPNIKYASQLKSVRDAAKNSEVGFWSNPEYGYYSSSGGSQ